jgi:transcriptional regulator with XRE-family HTH domain
MPTEKPHIESPQQRLQSLLAMLASQGLSQREIAAQANLPFQYLSDLKCGRRTMSELVARRLGEAFGVNFQWLSGSSNSVHPPRVGPSAERVWLPVHRFPITGEPSQLPTWDGTLTELAGAALGKLTQAQLPYVLIVGENDSEGRLRKGDQLLMSQTVKVDAEISVVKRGRNLVLARAAKAGGWRSLARGKSLPATCPPVGHCLGILWSAL